MRTITLLVLLSVGYAGAQPTPPGGARRPGGFRGPNIPPLEETGYRPIFDGKSLKGWDGDPSFWRVEDGALVGQTAADKQPKQNTFLIWRDGTPGNFELKLQYRLTGFNSGIQIRSAETPGLQWSMKGYQADMDGAQQFTGQFYEERGRGFLALRGQFTYIGEGQKPALAGSLGDNAALKEFIKPEDWNDLHLIARGNTLIQILNGHVMSMLIDDDTAGRKLDGLIGIQVHLGPPMKIEVRNIRIKDL
ncbi:MAG: DUF1080 domain-containing protein [Acidobacteria bacterium]|nr:DUF1080 domain-containing protein [Acidobacteriota bacterium]